MANNRMRIRCTVCGTMLTIAKYYPSIGWYMPLGTESTLNFEDKGFFDKHQHTDAPESDLMFGTHLIPEFE